MPLPSDGWEEDGTERIPAPGLESTGTGGAAAAGGPAHFLLGLSIRRHLAGYALLRFRDLLPLQFGLIDVRKALEVQQKAVEVAAALRELRQAAPQLLLRAAPDEQMAFPENSRLWRWVVSVDDSTVDRSPPTDVKQSATQRSIAMLQGMVIGDCKRLFRVAPSLVHPRRSRQLLGIRGLGPRARKEVYEIASAQVPDFPVVKSRNGVMLEDTLLMSDAWVSARCAQRALLVAEKRADASLMSSLRREALASKQLSRMSEAVAELHPRRASRELADVLESRVEWLVEERIQRLLDEEFGLARAVTETAKGVPTRRATTRGSAVPGSTARKAATDLT